MSNLVTLTDRCIIPFRTLFIAKINLLQEEMFGTAVCKILRLFWHRYTLSGIYFPPWTDFLNTFYSYDI